MISEITFKALKKLKDQPVIAQQTFHIDALNVMSEGWFVTVVRFNATKVILWFTWLSKDSQSANANKLQPINASW